MPPYHHGDLPTALLRAAELILERDGIGALTLRATAREAGVSHAAPAHHFGDISGLFTALAASGFARLRDSALAHAVDIGRDPRALLVAHARGYLAFARAYPGLFQLMFRSERLNWSDPVLAGAGAAAFELLTLPKAGREAPSAAQALVAATARWSFVHGMAMLLIDGRLGAMTEQMAGMTLESLIEELLGYLARQ